MLILQKHSTTFLGLKARLCPTQTFGHHILLPEASKFEVPYGFTDSSWLLPLGPFYMDQFEWTWTVCEHIGAGLQAGALWGGAQGWFPHDQLPGLPDWQSLELRRDSGQTAEAGWRDSDVLILMVISGFTNGSGPNLRWDPQRWSQRQRCLGLQ